MPIGPIQTAPQSLGALLTMKTRGQNPSQLLTDVQPTINLEDWYLRTKTERYTTLPTRNFPAAQAAVLVQWITADAPAVPQGEWWWVKAATIQLVLSAPTLRVRSAAVAYFQPPFVPFRFTAVGDGVDGDNPRAAGAAGVLVTARNFWMPPGSSLGLYVGLAEGPFDMSMDGLEFVRLKLADG